MALRPSTEALVTATGAYAFTSISVPFFTVTVSGGSFSSPAQLFTLTTWPLTRAFAIWTQLVLPATYHQG